MRSSKEPVFNTNQLCRYRERCAARSLFLSPSRFASHGQTHFLKRSSRLVRARAESLFTRYSRRAREPREKERSTLFAESTRWIEPWTLKFSQIACSSESEIEACSAQARQRVRGVLHFNGVSLCKTYHFIFFFFPKHLQTQSSDNYGEIHFSEVYRTVRTLTSG